VQGYHLPSVTLRDEDYAVLRRAAERVLSLGTSPLAPSAASALRKLAFDLPGVVPGDGEVALLRETSPAFESAFAALREGLEARRPVRCAYYAISRDQEEERIIHPYGLMLSWGIWYCIAFATERNAMRVYRIDRIRSASVLNGAPRFAIPPTFRVEEYLDRAPWELSENPVITVRVRLGFPHARWVMAEGLGTVVEAVNGDGGAVLDFPVRQVDAFVRWLLPFGSQVEIIEPVAVNKRLQLERARIRALYA
jgi:predicted DNA-binding transcriptional regulator YafY